MILYNVLPLALLALVFVAVNSSQDFCFLFGSLAMLDLRDGGSFCWPLLGEPGPGRLPLVATRCMSLRVAADLVEITFAASGGGLPAVPR